MTDRELVREKEDCASECVVYISAKKLLDIKDKEIARLRETLKDIAEGGSSDGWVIKVATEALKGTHE